MSFLGNQRTYLFTTAKNSIMAGIDDDLMDDINITSKQEKTTEETPECQVVVKKKPKKEVNGIEIVFKVINYCMDGVMLYSSIGMMSYYGAYPLIFCLGLIIWLGYRMLFFKRNKTVDVILGLFLFVAAVGFYIWAISDDYHEIAGRLMIPTVYLGYFCAWGAIRRKDKGNDGNDK